MDAEERALIAAIIAHPEEDTPRLVYADWLQEHDRPERAEYIRLSIQLANLRYGDPDFEAKYWQLRAARDPLVERFHERWEREFAAKLPPTRDVSFSFERGFVGGVWCSVKYFLDNGERMLCEAPIHSFGPNTLTRATTTRLLKSPLVKRLREMTIVNPQTALALLDAPLIEIEELDFSQPFLSNSGYWDRAAEHVAVHAGLKSLKRIDFENCGIGDLAGACLADARHLNLEVLNLLGSKLEERVKLALRKRYGPRVWLDPTDRNGFPRGRS